MPEKLMSDYMWYFTHIPKHDICSQLFLWQFKISWGFFVLQWVKGRGLTQNSEQQEMVRHSLFCFYFPASSQVMNWSIHSQFRSSCPWNHSWSSRSAPSGESLAWTTFLGTGVTWLTSTSSAALTYNPHVDLHGVLWCMASPADVQAEISSHCARLSFSRVGVSHHLTRWLDHLVPLPRLQDTGKKKKKKRPVYSNRDYRFQTTVQGRKVRETFRKPPAGGRTVWF